MNIYRINYLIAILLFGCLTVQAQNKNQFYIYYAPQRYTDTLQNILERQVNFRTYGLMLQANIDPKNDGTIDKELFVRSISTFYPRKLEKAVLCIDLENELYKNLFNYNKQDKDYQNSADAFIWMVNKVKSMRPNVKVGIYGLPFRFYYSQSKDPDSLKLDKIFSVCDYIFPSLYTMYPDSQFGRVKNEKYLTENLEIALEYGIRLRKPVIPFIWNVVHPSNNLYGKMLLTKKEMVANITFIKNFKYKNAQVKGIVWWDPDKVSFLQMVKIPLEMKNKDPQQVQSDIFQDYLKAFLKN